MQEIVESWTQALKARGSGLGFKVLSEASVLHFDFEVAAVSIDSIELVF